MNFRIPFLPDFKLFIEDIFSIPIASFHDWCWLMTHPIDEPYYETNYVWFWVHLNCYSDLDNGGCEHIPIPEFLNVMYYTEAMSVEDDELLAGVTMSLYNETYEIFKP